MKNLKKGFTLVEVMLFLAISGALVAGIIAATHSTIDQQRYNDSVQNFTEFLRTTYSEVSNPASNSTGNSKYAVYGKLITFGEKYTTDHKPNDKQKIFVYDVIGNISSSSISSNSLTWLNRLNGNVYIEKKDDPVKKYDFANTPKEYLLNWDAKLKTPKNKQFVGAILIVRSPASGSVYTYFYDKQLAINQNEEKPSLPKPLEDYLANFKKSEIDFCVIPEGYKMNPVQNIRIPANAHDAASIELIDLDGTENHCNNMI